MHTLSSISSISSMLMDRLPQPIADAWRRVHVAENHTESQNQCWNILETFLRYTSAILLANYFRSEPNPIIETMLEANKLEKPANGTLCSFIRELLKPLQEKPEHMFFEMSQWYFKKHGKLTQEAKHLEGLIAQRNKSIHGTTLTERELSVLLSTPQSSIQALERLLFGARWLIHQKVFRVSSTKITRRRVHEGRIWDYHGYGQPEFQFGQWSNPLFEDTIYLSNVTGTQFLELSPFVIQNSDRYETLMLWDSVVSMKYVHLRCDITLDSKKRNPLLIDKPVLWKDWIENRDKISPLITNTITRFFASKEYNQIGLVLAGRFELTALLGQGGMASVFKCTDHFMDEELALKIMPLSDVDSNKKDRIEQEYKVLEKLKHKNIITVSNPHILKDLRFFFCMPIYESSLKDQIKLKPMPLEQVKPIAEQLLSVLNHLAAQVPPILHRDIKPSNILMHSDGAPVLSDFGVAYQDIGLDLTQTGEALGTRFYMAPEVLRGHEATTASDRYSLAVTLHELLTQKKDAPPGHGIEGPFGVFLRQLGAVSPDARQAAVWPPPPLKAPPKSPEQVPQTVNTPQETAKPTLTLETPAPDLGNENKAIAPSTKGLPSRIPGHLILFGLTYWFLYRGVDLCDYYVQGLKHRIYLGPWTVGFPSFDLFAHVVMRKLKWGLFPTNIMLLLINLTIWPIILYAYRTHKKTLLTTGCLLIGCMDLLSTLALIGTSTSSSTFGQPYVDSLYQLGFSSLQTQLIFLGLLLCRLTLLSWVCWKWRPQSQTN